MDKPVRVDIGELKFVLVQFSLASKHFESVNHLIPRVQWTRPRPDDLPQTGQQIELPSSWFDLSALPYDIKEAGLDLRRVRAQTCKSSVGRVYEDLRFEFADIGSDQIPDYEEEYLGLFVRLLEEACWKARVYKNPYMEFGEVVDGVSALSLNLWGRRSVDMGFGMNIIDTNQLIRAMRIITGLLATV